MKGSILCLQSSAQAQSNISSLSHKSHLFILVLFIFLNVIRVCSTHAYMLDDLNLILMLFSMSSLSLRHTLFVC